MQAEIISIGTELLLGAIVDTNAAYISRRLAEIGIDLYHRVTVGDNEGRIARCIEESDLRHVPQPREEGVARLIVGGSIHVEVGADEPVGAVVIEAHVPVSRRQKRAELAGERQVRAVPAGEEIRRVAMITGLGGPG